MNTKKNIIEFIISLISGIIGTIFLTLGTYFSDNTFLAAFFGVFLTSTFYGIFIISFIDVLEKIFWK